MKIVVNNLLELLESIAPALQKFSKKHVKTILFFMLQFSSVCVVGQSFESYLANAKQGNVEAMSYVGICYINGTNVPKDEKQGFEWCYKAALKGNLDGMAMIGSCYTTGTGVEANLKQGFEWSLKAAQGGHIGAVYNVACDYMTGKGVTKNEKIGFNWFLKAALVGNAMAESQIGYCYSKGIGVEKNEQEGLNWYKKAAQHGEAVSQYNLGCIYSEGVLVDLDNEEAFKWFLKSAQQGFGQAQRCIGYMYYNGVNIKKDLTVAFNWFQKAAEGGDVLAMRFLGSCYCSGEGVEKNENMGFEWYLRAAKLGDETAMWQIGYSYLNGIGVVKDERKGFEWIKKTAEKNFSYAQNTLGNCYYWGQGTEQDYKQAFYWYEKAASQKLVVSYNMLAYCYVKGQGVQKNIDKAFEMIDNAISSEPTNLNYIDTKGELYSIINEKEKALEMYDIIMKTDPFYFKNVESQLYQYVMKIKGIDDVDVDIPNVNVHNVETFAIIIANENYKRVEKVPYALNDGKIFAEYCNKTLGVPEQNIHLVEDATLNDLKYNINWLQNVLKTYNGEGKVIFYYAGHGIPDNLERESYLLPVDGYGSDSTTGYALSSLLNSLGKLPAKSIVVFLDACFSGSKREEGMLASSRGVAIKARNSEPVGNVVVFSAAQNDETAYPYMEQQHGMFTYYVLKKIKESKGNVTLGELGDYVAKQVGRQSIVINGKSQSPMVVGAKILTDKWKKFKLNN